MFTHLPFQYSKRFIPLVAVLVLVSQFATGMPAAQPAPDESSTAAILEAYGKLPLSFEANQGQTDEQVKFLSRGSGYNLFLTATEAVLTLRQTAATESQDSSELVSLADVAEEGQPIDYAVLRMQLLQANPAPQMLGLDQLPGKVNYFLGSDPAGWRTDIPTYARVAYQGVYPGVDLFYYGNQGQLEYDFVVAPGADPASILLGFAGADSLTIDAQGDLVLRVGDGEIRQQRPFVYQELGGVRQAITGRYVLTGANQVGIAVQAYDPSRPLVIDPVVLVYSTFLGGTGNDQGNGIVVDSTGNAYVTGQAPSSNFPTTPGAFDTTLNGITNAFVTKLNPAGSALVYSTYLGGSCDDAGFGIAVDSTGSAYVTGQICSSNFPTTAGAFDTTFNGNFEAFVTKLNPAGSALVYSTYLGGSGFDQGNGIAVDSLGSAYVTGATDSSDFPTTLGAFATTATGNDAFVAKLNPAGSAPLVYSTYLGGSGLDTGYGIAVDSAGSAYVSGDTDSSDFPTTAGAFDTTLDGSRDAFVTKLNPAPFAPLVYSTYLGGSGFDAGRGIAVDSTGNAHATGQTNGGFPTTPGAFDTTFNGGSNDAFVTKLNPTGSSPLVYSTYLGGSGGDRGLGIALDSTGSTYVTGLTPSSNFPTTPGTFDPSFNGGAFDAFVTKLNPAPFAPLVYSTYLGGSGDDQGYGIAVDSAFSAYVTGLTRSSNFPTTPGAFDPSFNVNNDAFVTKLGEAVPTTLTLTPAADTNPVGTQHCVTATVRDAGGNPISGITVRFSVTGSVTTSGSATTNASGQAQFCYTGPNAPGADTITAYADTDNDSVQDPGEPFGTATKTWVAGAPATLTLTPKTATNTVDTQHCVTATVMDAFGNPTPGITVRFSVTGSVNTGGSATTDASGQAQFCYMGPLLPGADAIQAYADTDNDSTQDAGEPFDTATKAWTVPPSTELCEVKVTQGGHITADNGDRASFGGNAKVSADGEPSGQENYQDHGPAQPMHVHSINVLAVTCNADRTQATIYGDATIDGAGSFSYRIQVEDFGEPGKGIDTYWIILSNGYNSGKHILEGGNVQIHNN